MCQGKLKVQGFKKAKPVIKPLENIYRSVATATNIAQWEKKYKYKSEPVNFEQQSTIKAIENQFNPLKEAKWTYCGTWYLWLIFFLLADGCNKHCPI